MCTLELWGGILGEAGSGATIAVSYTHLDVYKRPTIYSDRSHTRSVSISGTTYYELAYVVSYHYIDGVQIRSMIAHGKQ